MEPTTTTSHSGFGGFGKPEDTSAFPSFQKGATVIFGGVEYIVHKVNPKTSADVETTYDITGEDVEHKGVKESQLRAKKHPFFMDDFSTRSLAIPAASSEPKTPIGRSSSNNNNNTTPPYQERNHGEAKVRGQAPFQASLIDVDSDDYDIDQSTSSFKKRDLGARRSLNDQWGTPDQEQKIAELNDVLEALTAENDRLHQQVSMLETNGARLESQNRSLHTRVNQLTDEREAAQIEAAELANIVARQKELLRLETEKWRTSVSQRTDDIEKRSVQSGNQRHASSSAPVRHQTGAVKNQAASLDQHLSQIGAAPGGRRDNSTMSPSFWPTNSDHQRMADNTRQRQTKVDSVATELYHNERTERLLAKAKEQLAQSHK